jgi:hypothetical protein
MFDEYSHSNESTLLHSCYYRDYRSRDSDGGYYREQAWYWVLFGKLLYIVVFEHFVYMAQTALMYLIPVESERVRLFAERQYTWDIDQVKFNLPNPTKKSVLTSHCAPSMSHVLRAKIPQTTDARATSNPGRRAIRRGRATQLAQTQIHRFGQ